MIEKAKSKTNEEPEAGEAKSLAVAGLRSRKEARLAVAVLMMKQGWLARLSVALRLSLARRA
jgi:hypothetical protein